MCFSARFFSLKGDFLGKDTWTSVSRRVGTVPTRKHVTSESPIYTRGTSSARRKRGQLRRFPTGHGHARRRTTHRRQSTDNFWPKELPPQALPENNVARRRALNQPRFGCAVQCAVENGPSGERNVPKSCSYPVMAVAETKRRKLKRGIPL